jgi:pyruvate,water dikinase
MAAAGLPVPAGFCISTEAHRRLGNQLPQDDADLAQQIARAYNDLGGGLVAVRSSATAEDGSVASFAGQQETFLGANGIEAVLGAVARCWESVHSERALAYRNRQGIPDSELTMAVVVQRLVPSEVAGVLFTRDPQDLEGRRMLVEASWGLGESVVAGDITPDRFQVDRTSGRVLDRHIASKAFMRTVQGQVPMASEKRDQACLADDQLAELADLGRRVEVLFGDARDVEWAWAEDRFWILQARPITVAGAAEREQVRQEEIAALKSQAESGGTVWSRYNLAEILPEPTPLTWGIVRRLMSGKGGLGLMYRDLGFDPHPSLNEVGIYDLVCGRPYCNLSREPRMQFRYLPYYHPFAALKAAPQQALYPQALLDPARASWRFWLFLPWHCINLVRSGVRLQRMKQGLTERLRNDRFPAFATETEQAAQEALQPLDTITLLERLDYWVERTLCDFARESLKPTVLAAVAFKELQIQLARVLGPARTVAALGELTMGIHPDPEADLPQGVRDLAQGQLDRAEFLRRFGHRGPQEMELAQPRWAEIPETLDRLMLPSTFEGVKPPRDISEVWERIATEAKLTAAQRKAGDFQNLRTFLALRETGKHYLMKGYALIRRILVELDRRNHLRGGVFYLTPEELPLLAVGEEVGETIAQRKRRRALALSLEVPQVFFSDDLEAIGRPTVVPGADTLQGVPLSMGETEGPALVLNQPPEFLPAREPFILVCPSTDPAWVPLFAQTRGLIMETGGVLSHGAIIAREYGLPAVAGIPGLLRRVSTGQRLRINGATGLVTILPVT